MQVVIVGAGIVGATLAYELSQVPNLAVTLLDRSAQPIQPEQTVYTTATAAALGVLMAAISKKETGRNLRMRLASLDWYNRIIPELERLGGYAVPVNRQGIVMLQFEADRLEPWQHLVTIRQSQGYCLQLWDRQQLAEACPHISLEGVIAGIYSPDDRQIDPTRLAQALLAVAEHQGVTLQFGVEVQAVTREQGVTLHTTQGEIAADVLVIAAGVGSFPLTQTLNQPVEIRPVLGQAVHLRLPQPLGNPDFQPVISAQDIHLVPIAPQEYWLGATVEFAPEDAPQLLQPDPQQFEALMQAAIGLWPALAPAERLRHWSGLRPRPQGRPAPIIEPLPGSDRVWLATGHYRNGVLLAPATAMAIKAALLTAWDST
jgi:glycine/D-amino acid oxidase-like deaminating enzyme